MTRRSNALGKLDRQEAILAQVRATPAVRIAKLAKQFHVSTETIRRDLDDMGERGLLSRTYGGAAGPPLVLEPSLDERYRTKVDQRTIIAKAARELVTPGDTLMIDAGSTTIYVARQLGRLARFDGHYSKLWCRVVTRHQPNYSRGGLSGQFDQGTAVLEGQIRWVFASFSATTAIIGASRLTPVVRRCQFDVCLTKRVK